MNAISEKILVIRVAGIIARQLDTPVYYKGNKLHVGGCQQDFSLQEALQHVVIDNEAIKKFYRNYTVPDWFLPFLKQRCLKSVSIKGRWKNLGRRLTNTSKVTSEEKIRTFTTPDTAKLYFTSNRVLDSKLEGRGEGFPIKNLIYPVLDIDADDDHEHVVKTNSQPCITCELDARRKLERVIRALSIIGYNHPTIIPSGTKGFHVHVTNKEVTEKEYLRILDHVNTETGGVCDDFSFVEDGKRHWDTHRVWRMPGSIDAGSLIILKPHKYNPATQEPYYDQFTTLQTQDRLKNPPTNTWKPGDLVVIKKSNIKDPFMEQERQVHLIQRIENITPGNYLILQYCGAYRPEWVRRPTKKELTIYGAQQL